MLEKTNSRLLDAREVHARIGSGWRDVLVRLGIPEACLSRRNSPCPACGGVDRFSFDRQKRGNGDFYCRGCGGGDGFDLLRRVHGWDFATALREVVAAAGIASTTSVERTPEVARRIPDEPVLAQPTARVRDLLRTACDPSDVPEVVAYLQSRHVWPLPRGCALRAHAGVDYFESGERIGRYAALVAPVVDIGGALVTCHVTYLCDGRKLADFEPRKLFGPLTGRHGCAVRLSPATAALGIAEGVETALAAMRLHKVPTWAALNAALLAKFEPPAGVDRLVIFADRDTAGLEAAWHLRDRLTIPCELHTPPAPANDWADELMREVARHG